jgi:hypothetical protein
MLIATSGHCDGPARDFPRAAKRVIHDQADAARAPTAFRRQPKHLYAWPGVVGGRTPVVTMVRTSRSVRKLQEQMIMKASLARGPYTS